MFIVYRDIIPTTFLISSSYVLLFTSAVSSIFYSHLNRQQLFLSWHHIHISPCQTVCGRSTSPLWKFIVSKTIMLLWDIMKNELWRLHKKLKPHLTYFLLKDWINSLQLAVPLHLDREFSYNSHVTMESHLIQESYLKLGKSLFCTWHTVVAKQFTMWNAPTGRCYHALKH